MRIQGPLTGYRIQKNSVNCDRNLTFKSDRIVTVQRCCESTNFCEVHCTAIFTWCDLNGGNVIPVADLHHCLFSPSETALLFQDVNGKI